MDESSLPTRLAFSPRASCNTPKRRRPSVEISDPRKLIIDGSVTFNEFRDSARKKTFNEFDLQESEDAVASQLIAKFGLKCFLMLVSSFNHVPSQFMHRSEYIHSIVGTVHDNISIKDIEECIALISKFETTDFFPNSLSIGFRDVLWRCSETYGEPFLNFIAPRVEYCINGNCGGNVYPCTKAAVTIFKMTGPEPGLKCSLRCRECGTRYHVSSYTVPNQGKSFYPSELVSEYRCASTITLFARDVYELLCESGNHAFVSHKAFAEIYNSVFSEKHHITRAFYEWRDFLNSNKGQSPEHDEHDEHDEDVFHDDLEPENYDEELELSQFFDENRTLTAVVDSEAEHVVDEDACRTIHVLMTGKMALKQFFSGELEDEIRERNQISDIVINKLNTASDIMQTVDGLRRNEIYKHSCSKYCRSKGCDNLRVIDGCWKLNMFVCMMAVPQEAKGYPLLSFPNTCILEPKPGSVFCKAHHEFLLRHNIPVIKDQYLRHIGCTSTDSNKMVERKSLQLSERLQKIDEQQVGETAIRYQGTEHLIKDCSIEAWEMETVEKEQCNKDIGVKGKLRQRSRGHFLCVTGGGHIMYFNPLFKSESPSQVFMLTIKVIYEDVKNTPEEHLEDRLKEYFLAYDNMCHLDNLKASKQDLPLPKPFKKLWFLIKKIMDRLHLANHKNPICKERYNPEVLPGGYNTQAAEQTFSWLSRFKKIVNSMSQCHHLFYIHRMIVRRNKYTASCRMRGKEPVLPVLRIAE